MDSEIKDQRYISMSLCTHYPSQPLLQKRREWREEGWTLPNSCLKFYDGILKDSYQNSISHIHCDFQDLNNVPPAENYQNLTFGKLLFTYKF